jgi:hypothetical protein
MDTFTEPPGASHRPSRTTPDAAAASFSLEGRAGMAQQLEKPSTAGAWANRYRNQWKWDKIAWGTHCVDCYPANCPYRVYVRDGRVVREEPAGTFRTIEEGVPDMNPAGCQRRHAGRHPGVGSRFDRAHRHSGRGRHAEHGPRRRRPQPSGRHHDRRPVRDQRLQPRPVHHLRALRPGRQQRRLVPLRAAAHLGEQPRLQRHPLVPLHRRGPLQRQRGPPSTTTSPRPATTAARS